jgi:hypothetical protein
MRTPFKWQGRYGAFTISPSHVSRVREYVLNQARHHANGSDNPVLERTEEEMDGSEPREDSSRQRENSP